MYSARDSHNNSGASQNSDWTSQNDQDLNKFLTFKLMSDKFGIEIIRVKELLEYHSATRVPLTPKEIHGVINLRGSVVPVINLATRIGKTSGGISKKTCIIIVELAHNNTPVEIGFLVDEVDQVINISNEKIEPTPQFGTDIDPEYIWGMGNTEDTFIILLDLENVLSVDELSKLIRQFT